MPQAPHLSTGEKNPFLVKWWWEFNESTPSKPSEQRMLHVSTLYKTALNIINIISMTLLPVYFIPSVDNRYKSPRQSHRTYNPFSLWQAHFGTTAVVLFHGAPHQPQVDSGMLEQGGKDVKRGLVLLRSTV